MDNLKINITPEWVEKEDEGGVTLELQNILNFKVKGIKNKDDWDAVKLKIESLISTLNNAGGDVPKENLKTEILTEVAKPITPKDMAQEIKRKFNS